MTITARKVYHQIRDQRAEKRGRGQVRGESVFGGSPDEALPGIEQVVGCEPSPSFAVMVAEECTALLDALDDDSLREIARLKLEGYTNDEIAAQLGCVTRSVERKLQRIRSRWISSLPA